MICFGIGIQQAKGQRRVQYPDQPTLIIEASPAPDVFTCNHSVSHLNTRTQPILDNTVVVPRVRGMFPIIHGLRFNGDYIYE